MCGSLARRNILTKIAAFLVALDLVRLVVILWPPADLTTGGIIDLSFRLPKMAWIAWYAPTDNLIGHGYGHAFEPRPAGIVSSCVRRAAPDTVGERIASRLA